jgi:hypothetical protein
MADLHHLWLRILILTLTTKSSIHIRTPTTILSISMLTPRVRLHRTPEFSTLTSIATKRPRIRMSTTMTTLTTTNIEGVYR